jgi:intracellular septation protein A
MLFFALVVIIYGGIGIQFTSEEYIEDMWKPYKDYTDFGSMVVNLYIMITFDNWPAFTKPLLGTPA